MLTYPSGLRPDRRGSLNPWDVNAQKSYIFVFYSSAHGPVLCLKIGLWQTRIHRGELTPFFCFAFLSALWPELCLKKCFRKTCLHRRNYRVFFVFAFLVVLESPLFRDILGWILAILGVFLGWGGASAAWGGTPWRPESLRDDFGMLLGGF